MKPFSFLLFLCSCLLAVETSQAQTPPSKSEIAAYKGLHAVAWNGNIIRIRELLRQRSNTESRDDNGRTALHVAAFASHEAVVKVLVAGGFDVNALENDRYDIITIAAVANDLPMLNLALELGGNPKNITSRYDGTALIAAAHLGHYKVVKILIDAGAPLDHINNLNWTALLEAVILGDGGLAHQKILAVLLKAGADKSITDDQGRTPLDHAKTRRFSEMIKILR